MKQKFRALLSLVLLAGLLMAQIQGTEVSAKSQYVLSGIGKGYKKKYVELKVKKNKLHVKGYVYKTGSKRQHYINKKYPMSKKCRFVECGKEKNGKIQILVVSIVIRNGKVCRIENSA